MDLVEVGATEEVAAGAADQLAAGFGQAGGAVGAEDGVMFQRQHALGWKGSGGGF